MILTRNTGSVSAVSLRVLMWVATDEQHTFFIKLVVSLWTDWIRCKKIFPVKSVWQWAHALLIKFNFSCDCKYLQFLWGPCFISFIAVSRRRNKTDARRQVRGEWEAPALMPDWQWSSCYMPVSNVTYNMMINAQVTWRLTVSEWCV